MGNNYVGQKVKIQNNYKAYRHKDYHHWVASMANQSENGCHFSAFFPVSVK